MKHILPSYNDPLFSIMLIFIIAFIIILSNYLWEWYDKHKEEGKLLKFLDKFDSTECTLDTMNMPFKENMLKPFGLLAKAFDNAGEYSKSINIYLYLMKHIQHEEAKLEIMERLGDTYLHAGFLERCLSIYTEILRKKPHNIKVLYNLGIVYESLQKFDKVQEVLTPLKTLGEDTKLLENFISFSMLIANKKLSLKKKVTSFKTLLEKDTSLYRQTIKILLKIDPKSAWEVIEKKEIKEIIDILWFLPQSQLELDIINANKKLQTLYYAKGYLTFAIKESGIFSLDILAIARQNGFKEGDLHFSYLCKKCKQTFPVSFRRCPNCMALNSVQVEESIAKLSPQTSFSLV